MEGAFAQNHDDSQTFMKGHPNVQLEPFPGFTQITRKDCLWRNFHAMQLKFGRQHFDFLEECLMMPQQRSQLVQALAENPKQWWIVKPPGRNNGSGIYLINFESDIPEPDTEEEVMVQRYLPRPYLINGCKFDLRIYVLITSVDPLRVYIYDEGLVRFCVNKYSMDPAEISDKQMHVCNYDVNKQSEKFTDNEDPLQPQGHKWTLSGLRQWMKRDEAERTEAISIDQMWAGIEDLVVKSILCGLTSLKEEMNTGQKKEVKSTYNMYKLLGYDILLDSHRKPHLIEVNARPACLNNPLDAFVNRPMINEMFKIVGYHIPLDTLSNLDRKNAACSKLNIPNVSSQYQIGYSPELYSMALDGQSLRKQKNFKRKDFNRAAYLEQILEDLTSSDVRVLVKGAEEASQARHFSRVFPKKGSHKYFQYFDSLSYYDKLLDAFEEKFFEKPDKGNDLINSYCQKNVHQ